MSRLQQLFERKKKRVLNIYCTAGFPQLHSTLEVLMALQEHGADMIELGIPYSDPLADGPVIQQSSTKALNNGMSIRVLFEQLKNFRPAISVPVVLMGYMNPVLQYGFERFCADASLAGIDGLILPDLPPYEYETQYQDIIKKYRLDFIFLVTPETGDERIKKLDALSSGFLYAVTSSSTTGSAGGEVNTEAYLQRLRLLDLENPVLVGFGISDKKDFDKVCHFANGGIIGSAFIKAIANSHNLEKDAGQFLKDIL